VILREASPQSPRDKDGRSRNIQVR
jgi:hypothetical protein